MRRLRVAWLPDGKRLHLHNGPVDLIIQVFGRPAEVGRAYEAAIERARALVLEMAGDLPLLQAGLVPQTQVGQRAAAACAAVPGALGPVTALSGAMADEVLAAMAQAGRLDRGFANSRGAVAVHLAEGQSIMPEIFDSPDCPRYEAKVPLTTQARTRGILAVGWKYEPFALGYADRLCAAAPTAAQAAAAVGSIAARMRPVKEVATVPADSLAPLCVLGGMAVYTQAADLAADEAAAILAQGRAAAEAMYAAGTITYALLEIGEARFLAARPQFSLKSMWNLEG